MQFQWSFNAVTKIPYDSLLSSFTSVSFCLNIAVLASIIKGTGNQPNCLLKLGNAFPDPFFHSREFGNGHFYSQEMTFTAPMLVQRRPTALALVQ